MRALLARSPLLLRAKEPGTGFSPLVACLLGGEAGSPSLTVLQAVLADGDVRSDTCEAGRNPLHFAAKAHWQGSEALSWLLKRGVDVNGSDCDGLTPLHCAVQGLLAPEEAVRQLMACGADPLKKDAKGRSVVDLARMLRDHGAHDEHDAVHLALGGAA